MSYANLMATIAAAAATAPVFRVVAGWLSPRLRARLSWLRLPMGTCARMTSQGSAMRRFELALETRDPNRIVPAALELPRPIHLSHAVRVLLALRDVGAGERYRGSAARFATQLVRKRALNLADSQLLYSALEGLGSTQPAAAAAALEALLRTHDEGLAAAHVQTWLDDRSHHNGC